MSRAHAAVVVAGLGKTQDKGWCPSCRRVTAYEIMAATIELEAADGGMMVCVPAKEYDCVEPGCSSGVRSVDYGGC